MDEERKKKMQAARKTGIGCRKKLSHRVRTADRGFITLTGYTARMAIKVMCMECLGFEDHPKDCTAPTCPLFPYRARTLITHKGDGGGKTA